MNSVALIVTYNRLTKLKKCLEATLLLSFDHIVVVNNMSTDETMQWLTTQTDPRLHILTTKQNSGGAGGFKYGSQYITSNLQTDWVFFFDDDAYPTLNLLNQFEAFNKKNYQLFCSKVLLPSGKLCKMNIPYKKVPYSVYQTFLYNIFPRKFLPNFKQQEEVETFSFVGAIVHQNILRQYSDQIDEKLFIYFDDILFSYYLTRSNYKIHLLPQLIFIHDTNVNTNIYKEKKIYYLVRNLIYLRKKQYSPFSKLTIFLRVINILILCIFKGRKIRSIVYFLKGIKDGLLFR